MGRFFAVLGAIAYYMFYPFILIIILFGPLMEFPTLLEVYELGSPREGLSIGLMGFIGFLFFLSYKYPRLGWLYRRLPVMMPLLQMFFITLVGIELAIFFANLWADQLLYSKGVAIGLSVLSILIARAYLSYWYSKYPISYKVHKL